MDGDCVFIVTIVYAKGEEEVDDQSLKTRAFSNIGDAQWYRSVVAKKVYRLYKYQGPYSLSQDLIVDDNDDDLIDAESDDDAEEEQSENNNNNRNTAKYANDPDFILVDHKPECTYIVANNRDRNSLYTVISVRRLIIGEL